MSFGSFLSIHIVLDNDRSLRVFVGPQPIASSNEAREESPVDAFVSTADLATGFGLKASSIRGELSKKKLGTLTPMSQLKSWMIQQKIIPANSGKVNFATQNVWLRLVKRHCSDETYRATIIAIERAILQAQTFKRNDNNDANHNDNNHHTDNNESLSCRGLDVGFRDEGVGVRVSATQPPVRQEEEMQELEDDVEDPFSHCRNKDSDDHGDDDDEDNGGDEDWKEDPKSRFFERKNERKRGRGGIDSDVGRNDSPANSDSSLYDHNGGYGSDPNSHSSGGIRSDSSDSSDSSDGIVIQLPVGRGDYEWVLTAPVIPDQFSVNDYTKSHSLKEYDISKSLKKELKKLNIWWTIERNNERKNKAVASTTAGKREERALCFLGFVDRYRCLPPNHKLTLYLFLNHRLMESYLEYLKQVRKSSPGTLSETLTAAISACRWLYRKTPRGIGGGAEPLIIRRYKDWRNLYQAKAAKIRKMDDVDELKEQNKWLSWDQFTSVVHKMRLDWDRSLKLVNIESALMLHDLLLLGIYSCVPSRGSEIRLLQHLSVEEITRKKGNLTLKRFVDKEKINLITQTLNVDDGCSNGSVWKIFVADFKNYRSIGVDVTELSSFQWWIELFELYMASYRSLLVDKKNKHNYVFLTKTGKPFSGPYYSDYISSLLFKHTGVRAATNLLRSSFVTTFYGSEASKDVALRDSVASVMRHSATEAQKTYDRRTATQRKRAGLQLMADMNTHTTHKKRHQSHQSHQSDEHVDEEDTPPPHQPTHVVVEYSHVPYCVIQEEADRYLLAKMQRSSKSNAPRYFVPPYVVYEWQEKEKCSALTGEWEENEFVLV